MRVTRQPPASNVPTSTNEIINLFSTANARASSAQKVTTSLLINLIKDVKNSHEEINLLDFKGIESTVEKLSITLSAQKSNQFNAKHAHLIEAARLAKSKLSQVSTIEVHRSGYRNQLDCVKLASAELLKKSGYLMSQVNELTKDFSSKMQKKALDLIATGAHSSFRYDSPVTRAFFPDVDVPLEPGVDASKPDSLIRTTALPANSSHSDLHKWTYLESLSRNQMHVDSMSEFAVSLINKESSFMYPPRNAQAEREFAQWKDDLSYVAEHYADDVGSILGATKAFNLSDTNSGILNLSGVTTSDSES